MDVKRMIKKMEEAKRKESLESIKNQVVTFDSWYYMREPKIPPRHAKEIIWAFFNSLKLKKQESVQAYDAALIKYGIKL